MRPASLALLALLIPSFGVAGGCALDAEQGDETVALGSVASPIAERGQDAYYVVFVEPPAAAVVDARKRGAIDWRDPLTSQRVRRHLDLLTDLQARRRPSVEAR